MKIDGRKLDKLVTGEVTLPRPNGDKLVLTVSATGLGDEGKGERLFPDVRPPSDYVYDRKQNVIRDPVTRMPLREPNPYDPGYMAAQETASLMQFVVKAVDALAADPTVHWDTDAPHGTKEFYIACHEEMKAAGFTFGDIRLILAKCRELGNLDSRKLEEAAESFSSEGE